MNLRARLVLFLFVFASFVAFVGAASGQVTPLGGDACDDGSCPIPAINEDNEPVYAIVSPVGYRAVDMIEQAPRLKTLAGQKIALVGGSFSAAITRDELRRLIEKDYPTAQVVAFEEVGSAGPYSVFGQSGQTIAFQKKLKELGIDAVVSGNCGCGLCTTKETGSSIAAEYVGIPSVTIGAPTFIAQIRSTGVNRGVPALRTAEYPGAFASHSEEELRRNTREVVWPQIVKGLTTPITQSEIDEYAGSGKRPFDEVVYTGTFDEIQEFCQVNGWTDGLPIVPPTNALVQEYLRFTPYAPEETLGVYPLAYRECAVYTVAVNAATSGVPKELTPICVALTQALANGEWRRPLASTHGWSPYAWINGPLARQLGIDSGQGMISERTNKALGRFLDLIMLNLGGYYVKENRMGTFGYLTPFVFAEDEEACLRVGWTPYHVSRGFDLNANAVTAASALAWGNNVTPATDDPERIMNLVAFDVTEKQQNGLGNTNPQVDRTILLTEPVARDLAKKYEDKSALESDLVATARRPLFMRAYANYWANTGGAKSAEFSFDEYYDKLRKDPQEQAALTDTPEWLKGLTDKSRIETIATTQKGQTAFLIAGDGARNKFMVLPGGGRVTFEIQLPENWDELVAPLGYAPLRSFYLDEPESKTVSASNPNAPSASRPDAGRGVPVPAGLSDGEYRLVPTVELITEEGRIYRSAGGAASAWSYGATSAATLPIEEDFSTLMKALFSGCSITVEKGRVVGVVLRPQSSGARNLGNATGLTSELLGVLDVTIGVVTRTNRREGKATTDGAILIVNTRTTRFEVDLGGVASLAEGGVRGFLTLDGNRATVDPRASEGATATLVARGADGTRRTLTFTKRDRRTVVAEYRVE